MVTQISIFIENKQGRLAEVTRMIAECGANLRAISIADTTDFGILRVIVDKPELVGKALKDKELTIKTTSVLAIEITDEPGSLANALALLSQESIVVEYMYAFLEKNNKNAVVIAKLSNPEIAKAVLEKNGYGILDAQKVYSL